MLTVIWVVLGCLFAPPLAALMILVIHELSDFREEKRQRGKVKCRACGACVAPKVENLIAYRCSDGIIYDEVMDCPVCGCQIRLGCRRGGAG